MDFDFVEEANRRARSKKNKRNRRLVKFGVAALRREFRKFRKRRAKKKLAKTAGSPAPKKARRRLLTEVVYSLAIGILVTLAVALVVGTLVWVSPTAMGTVASAFLTFLMWTTIIVVVVGAIILGVKKGWITGALLKKLPWGFIIFVFVTVGVVWYLYDKYSQVDCHCQVVTHEWSPAIKIPLHQWAVQGPQQNVAYELRVPLSEDGEWSAPHPIPSAPVPDNRTACEHDKLRFKTQARWYQIRLASNEKAQSVVFDIGSKYPWKKDPCQAEATETKPFSPPPHPFFQLRPEPPAETESEKPKPLEFPKPPK